MTDPINWKTATDETVDHLSRLIRAETVNPPGNEEPAIRVVKEILEREGFGSEDFENFEIRAGTGESRSPPARRRIAASSHAFRARGRGAGGARALDFTIPSAGR